MSDLNVEVSVPGSAFTLGQILQTGTGVSLELTQFVPTGGRLVPYFRAETSEPESFARAVRADERVSSLTRHDGSGGQHLYSIEWTAEDDDLLAALREHDVLVERGVSDGTTWWFRLRSPNHENVSSFQQRLRERGVPLDVRRIQQTREATADIYGVTEKQQEVLRRAYEMGYFKVPKQTSLDAIAEEFDITPQAVSGRLNRGVDNLLRNTVVFDM